MDFEQLEGNSSISTDYEENDMFSKTIHYWRKVKFGTVFQTFLDAIDVIEESDITEEIKKVEKAKVLDARKQAFGSNFKHFPPWCSK